MDGFFLVRRLNVCTQFRSCFILELNHLGEEELVVIAGTNLDLSCSMKFDK